MLKIILPILLLSFINSAVYANSAATPYQFGYEIGNMTNQEKAALIQSQVIISLNPMLKKKARNSDNGSCTPSTCETLDPITVTAADWIQEPVNNNNYSAYPVPPLLYKIMGPSPQDILNNTYSLALDGPGVMVQPITSFSKYASKCRRSKLSGDVICQTAYMTGSQGRHYPKELSFLEIMRIESHIRVLVDAITNTRGSVTAKNTIREAERVKMLSRLNGGELDKTTFIMTDDDFAGAKSWLGEVYLPRDLVKYGLSEFTYLEIDGSRVHDSLLQSTVHEMVHVLLKGEHNVRTLEINGSMQDVLIEYNLELKTVILTNKILAGIEKPRGFYFNTNLGRYLSINEVNIVIGASSDLDLVGDYIRVPENIHRAITSLRPTAREMRDATYKPIRP